MTRHLLKTWPKYFNETYIGRKLFEFRENDRDFQIGDTLLLQEYDISTETYTGRELGVEVTLVLSHKDFPSVPETHVIMGIEHPGQKLFRGFLKNLQEDVPF